MAYDVTTMDMSRTSTTAKPYMPGDNVLVRDLEDGINIIMPIVSVKKSDVTGNPFEVELEVANESRDIAGTISDLAERSRISDTYSQGATNLQQIAYADNADASHGLELSFYIPAEMARINKLLLRYNLEAFRAYSQATQGGGARSSTTSSGGSTYQSTGSGGSENISESTGSGGGVYETTHGAYVDAVNVEYTVYGNDGSVIGHTAPIYKLKRMSTPWKLNHIRTAYHSTFHRIHTVLASAAIRTASAFRTTRIRSSMASIKAVAPTAPISLLMARV